LQTQAISEISLLSIIEVAGPYPCDIPQINTKLHHCGHYMDQVRLFGSLTGYNSSITENCHIVFCKNPYHKSNKVGEFVVRILANISRREAFSVRQLNYDAWKCSCALTKTPGNEAVRARLLTLQREQSRAAFLDGCRKSQTEGDASVSSRPDGVLDLEGDNENEPIVPGSVPTLPSAQPKDKELKSIQNFKGQHMIRLLRDLLLNIPSGLHELLYDAVDRYLVNDGVGVPREHLMQCNASLYYGLDVQIDKFLSDEWETCHIHATNGEQWYKLPARQDWIWVRVVKATRKKAKTRRYGTTLAPHNHANEVFAYGALGGRHLAKAYFFFKIQVHRAPSSNSKVYKFAFVQTTKAHNSGTTRRIKERVQDNVDHMPRVIRSTMEVIPIGAIDGPAHLILVENDNARNSMWIVNTHVDIETWNMIFDRKKYN
jgi:hypothetical protein